MKRNLQAQHVPNNQYVEFAAYKLLGEAQDWWQGECRLLQLQNANIPWDVFQTAFYKKYFPESAREEKEMKLMQLKEGSLSVADYTSRFEELYRFSRVCQGASETYESWKCIKYQRSLKDNIMSVVAPLEIRIFSNLVDKARVVKEYAKTVASSRDTHGGNNSRGRGKYFQPRGGCFNCGLPGHIAKDCTCGKNPNVGQSQHQRRVYDVNANDATKANPLMRVEELGLKVSELAFELHVHTLHQTVMTWSGCRQFMPKGENGAVIAEGYYLNSVMVHCSGEEYQGYILLAANTLGDNQKLDQISVVRGFPKVFSEVFPEDIPEFPPQREIDFAIELVSEAGLVSIVPYRMAPIELAELKTQLEEWCTKL
ncbi:uncharacterized protein LOC130980662 [Arachis stenosperma]|uniref:uncharacterized protein LOC130980662 n=1 Tax=Arachis stenosperma TaxID=217475 RepID=UPI0025AC6C15|nr:uncharacterized protein LOC130980662 [Arachis stenosperma]